MELDTLLIKITITLIMHIFLPTVSQKQAVNKKDSVGTIALTRTEVVERPYQK